MPKFIPPLEHRCIIQHGDLAGNDHVEEISSWQIEYNDLCPNCAEPLVSGRKIMAHIYEHLIQGE